MNNSQLVEHTYRKHHNWLSQVAYNFTNNKDNAEELVQELYLKMMESSHNLQILSIKTLLYKMPYRRRSYNRWL